MKNKAKNKKPSKVQKIIAAPAKVEEVKAAPIEQGPTINDILNGKGNNTLIVGKMSTPIQQHPQYALLAGTVEQLLAAYLCGIELAGRVMGLKIDVKTFLMVREDKPDGNVPTNNS